MAASDLSPDLRDDAAASRPGDAFVLDGRHPPLEEPGRSGGGGPDRSFVLDGRHPRLEEGSVPAARGGRAVLDRRWPFRSYVPSIAASVLVHAAALGAAIVLGVRAKPERPAPPPHIEVLMVKLPAPGSSAPGGGGGGGGGPGGARAALAAPTPARPPAVAPRAPAPALRPAPAPALASIPAPQLPAAAPAPAAAAEDVPAAPAVDQSPAATPAAEAVNGAAPGGDAALEGPGTGGGTGGGTGRGHGTGTGDGTGSGHGSGAGDGKGTGTGSGSGSNVAILDGPRPPYPPMARRAGWQGVVVLNVLVAPDGSAASVTVRATSGREVLDDAAVKAVRRWRFSPATRAGDPIARRTELAVRFRLDEAP